MSRGVAVVAHRGASGTHPENTAVAFAEAVRLQVDAIELDVHASADGGLIVIHDATVDRTSDGRGAVAEMTEDQIKALDAGAWFDAAFAAQRFLLLAEALEQIPPSIRLNVHIKAYDFDRAHLAVATVDCLAAAERLSSSFIAADEPTLAAVRDRAPEIEICNLSTHPIEDYVQRSERIGCRILQPGHAVTTPELVTAAHERGMEVNPFYADSEAEMLRLIECGVDGILTNQPERLQRLRQVGQAIRTS
jgi:glycerophosphoryl diester phosphodiesterase